MVPHDAMQVKAKKCQLLALLLGGRPVNAGETAKGLERYTYALSRRYQPRAAAATRTYILKRHARLYGPAMLRHLRLKTMKSMRDFVVTASKIRVAAVHCTAALLVPLRYDQPVPQTRRHWRRPQRVGW